MAVTRVLQSVEYEELYFIFIGISISARSVCCSHTAQRHSAAANGLCARIQVSSAANKGVACGHDVCCVHLDPLFLQLSLPYLGLQIGLSRFRHQSSPP